MYKRAFVKVGKVTKNLFALKSFVLSIPLKCSENLYDLTNALKIIYKNENIGNITFQSSF